MESTAITTRWLKAAQQDRFYGVGLDVRRRGN